jgi:hypothetical protein
MRADDLTRQQAAAIRNKLGPMLAYLYRLKRRMDQKGFPEDDPLVIATQQATSAMCELHNEVMCRSIDGRGRNVTGEQPPEVDLMFTRKSKARKHER